MSQSVNMKLSSPQVEPSISGSHQVLSEPGIQWKKMNVPQLFMSCAQAMPDALALSEGHEAMTYGELDRRSNRLAHYLCSLGAKRDTLVALCLGRSLAQISGALAILKAGSAYVPLDPAYPLERLSFMLKDAQPRVVITNKEMAERLPAGRWRTVRIDEEMPELEQQPIESPSLTLGDEDIAYVIYTSGSTGKPKGVQITHQNLLNLVSWHQRSFAVTAQDRSTHLASVGFDAAVWEVWSHLTVGASLHLPDEALRYQPEALRDWLVEQKITISFVPTLLGERLISLNWPAETRLRVLLTGADVLHHYPSPNLPFTLINNYGPTECAVVATSAPVSCEKRPDLLPPIGWPIDNTQVYILDEQRRQVPLGSVGELYIGGAGVARGYHANPELTAEKFISDPFNPDSHARLYRTGDLGRRLPDGQIAFLGRIDDQVKIRGYRVELNEVVATIDEHPEVELSFVLAHEDQSGQKSLVAYIVPKSGSQPSATELRSFLTGRLPDYMVPQTFVPISSLPLNANGKVDRSALPAPHQVPQTEIEVTPRAMIEERLGEILAVLLNIPYVAVNDNFFFLGGNSLLGTQLISRIRDTFGVEIPLLGLFDHPTIAELANEIETLILEKLETADRDVV